MTTPEPQSRPIHRFVLLRGQSCSLSIRPSSGLEAVA